MIFVGIDPGLTGGIAALDEKGVPLFVGAFSPTKVENEFDMHKLCDILTDLRCEVPHSNRMLIGLEKVHAMPKQGVSSTFKFGSTFGKIQGILAAKHLPFELVRPQEWMNSMLAGEAKDLGKVRAKNVSHRLFPDVDFRASARSTTVHSGMADAILIAEFMRRKYGRGV